MASIIADLKAMLSVEMDSSPFREAQKHIEQFNKNLQSAQKNLQAQNAIVKENQKLGRLSLSKKSHDASGAQKRVETLSKTVEEAKKLSNEYVVAKQRLIDMGKAEKDVLTLQQQLLAATKRLSQEAHSGFKRPSSVKEVKDARAAFSEIARAHKTHIETLGYQHKEGTTLTKEEFKKMRGEMEATHKKSADEIGQYSKQKAKETSDFTRAQAKKDAHAEGVAVRAGAGISADIVQKAARDKAATKKTYLEKELRELQSSIGKELAALRTKGSTSKGLQQSYDEAIKTGTYNKIKLLKLHDQVHDRTEKNVVRRMLRQMTYAAQLEAIEKKLSHQQAMSGKIAQIANIKAAESTAVLNAKNREAKSILRELNKVLDENSRLKKRVGKQNEIIAKALSTEELKKQSKAVGFLSTNFRDLSSMSVLAVGPLSGIGARISAIGAMAGRTNMKMALLLGVIGGGLGLLWKFSKAMVRVRMELESATNLFDKLRSAGEGVGQTFENLYNLSLKFGADLSKIARPVARLKASLRGTELAGAGFKSMLADIINVSGKFQLSGDEIGGTMKAFEQMFSKGAVYAEEFKQQLGDRIPGVFSAGLEAFRKKIKSEGVNTMAMSGRELSAAFYKAMKKGTIDPKWFVPSFLKEMKRLNNIGDEGTNTLAASFQRLSTSFDKMLYDFDKALGITDALVSGMDELSKFINNVKDQVKPLTKAFSSLIRIGSLFGGMWLFKKSSIVGVTRQWGEFNKKFGATKGTLIKMKSVTNAVAGAGLVLHSTWGVAGKVIGDVGTVASKTGGILKELVGISNANASTIDFGDVSANASISSVTSNFKKSLTENGKLLKDYISNAQNELNKGLVLTPKIEIASFVKNFKAQSKKLKASIKSSGIGLSDIVAIDSNKKDMKKVLNVESMVKEFDILRQAQAKVATETSTLRHLFRLLTSNIGTLASTVETLVNIWATWKLAKFIGLMGLANKSLLKMGVNLGKLGKGKKAAAIGIVATATALIYSTKSAKANAKQLQETISLTERMKAALSSKGVRGERILSGKKYIEINTIAQEMSAQSKYLEGRVQRLKDVINLMQTSFKDAGSGGGVGAITDKLKGLGLAWAGGEKSLASAQRALKETTSALANNNMVMGYSIKVRRRSTEALRAAMGIKDFKTKLGEEEKVRLALSGALGKQTTALNRLVGGYNAYDKSTDKINSTIDGWKTKMLEAVKNNKKAKKAVEAILPTLNNLRNILQQINTVQALSSFDKTFDAITAKYEAVMKGAKAYKAFQDNMAVESTVKPLRDALAELNPESAEFIEKSMELELAIKRVAATNVEVAKFGASTKRTSDNIKELSETFTWLKDAANFDFIKDLDSKMNSLGDNIADVMTNGELSFKSFGQVFADMARSMLKDMIALIIKINILKPLMESLSKGSGGWTTTSSSGELMSGVLGGLNSMFGGGMFAKGAVISQGTPMAMSGGRTGLMGEAGPEAVIPLTRKNGRLGIADNDGPNGGGDTFSFTFNMSTKDSDAERRELPSVIIKTIQDAKRRRII